VWAKDSRGDEGTEERALRSLGLVLVGVQRVYGDGGRRVFDGCIPVRYACEFVM